MDGDENTGVYEAVLAPPLLSATGLDDGSIRVTMIPYYAAPNIAVGQAESDLPLPLLVLWQLVFCFTTYTAASVAVLIVGGGVMIVWRRRT